MNDLTDQPPGATPLDDISGLLQSQIITQEQLNAAEQLNVQQAGDWLDRTSGVRSIFTVSWLKELHQQMYKDVWSWAGEFRKTTTNVGVPPHTVPMRLGEAAANFNDWFHANRDGMDVLRFAANYHHHLVFIHPFPDGNGRWARLAVDTVFTRLMDKTPPIWSRGALHDAGDERVRYIDALKEADSGNIQLLVDYLSTLNAG